MRGVRRELEFIDVSEREYSLLHMHRSLDHPDILLVLIMDRRILEFHIVQ
jgi:hypothetical protein